MEINAKPRRVATSPRINITMSQESIAEGVARDSNHCMIAEQIKKAVANARGVSVDLATIRFTDPKKGLRYTYLTPRVAQVYLVNFDQGRKVEPFSFVLRGAQVTRSGRDWPKQERTPAQTEVLVKARAARARLRSVPEGSGNVPDRVDGQTPPMQMLTDNVPFSRRRAFGLRALQY